MTAAEEEEEDRAGFEWLREWVAWIRTPEGHAEFVAWWEQRAEEEVEQEVRQRGRAEDWYERKLAGRPQFRQLGLPKVRAIVRRVLRELDEARGLAAALAADREAAEAARRKIYEETLELRRWTPRGERGFGGGRHVARPVPDLFDRLERFDG